MFEARLANASTLKKILDAMKDLLTDGTWDCTENGLALQAMDSSHVALVSLKLDANGFEEYRCDRSVSLGINLANMSKIMRCAGNDDAVTLRAQDDPDTLTMIFESPGGERQCEFELKLMELETERLGIPDQEYNCVVTLGSGDFSRICRDLSQLGDSMQITCAKKNVQFSVKGDSGNGAIRLSQGQSADDKDQLVTVEMQEPVNVTFAVKYLNHFCKAAPLAEQCSLSISNDVPIVIEFPIEQLGFMKYYLAPKIEEEDTS